MEKYFAYLAGIIYSSIFGFSFLFTKEALELVEPFHFLAFRFSIAAITLTILVLMKIIKLNFRGKRIGLLLLLALFQPCLYFIFETLGISMTSSSEAGMIIALIPVFVTILAAVFLNEKPSLVQLLFVLLSVSGVIFIALMKDSRGEGGKLIGIVCLILAVIMAAVFNILSRKLSLKFRPIEITFVMMWFGAVFFNILAFISNKGDLSSYLSPIFNKNVITAVMYLGLLSSVLAFFLMNYTLSKIEAARAAVFAYFSTIVSILAGVFIRGEDFYWYQILGAFLIICGVWGTNYFGKRRNQSLSKSRAVP